MNSVPTLSTARRRRSFLGAALATTLAFSFSGCAADDGDTPAGTVDPVAQWKADGAKILAAAPCGTHPMTCQGAKLPKASLKDFNPTSATFDQTKTLGELSDKPKVVALLAAW